MLIAENKVRLLCSTKQYPFSLNYCLLKANGNEDLLVANPNHQRAEDRSESEDEGSSDDKGNSVDLITKLESLHVDPPKI